MDQKCSPNMYRNLASLIYTTCLGRDIMYLKKPPRRVWRNA